MELPGAYVERMKELLGAEWPDYLACLEQPPVRGVRWNPLKCSLETLRACVPYALTATPFSPLSFAAAGEDKPGPLPAHHAGMFYVQEPSAASAVTALDPRPGERVLDLCAAPGGKSTQIGSLLGGEGLLWSNEIVRGRTGALLSNLERLGIPNGVVSCCHPETLCRALAGFFDRVLVDAPCSGEGMFRRDPRAAAEWTPESPAACAQRQGAILDSAARAVREGGVLVYSTCTFSPEENEETVAAFLGRHPEFVQEAIPAAFGRPALDGSAGRRIFPMDGGEGHFVARLRRVGENPCAPGAGRLPALRREERSQAAALWEELFRIPLERPVARFGEKLLLLPEGLPDTAGLGVLRAGVELAAVKGRRLEPCHGVFLAAQAEACRRRAEFSPSDPRLAAFLRGEELDWDGEKGVTAVCVAGATVGFGKAAGGRLKNHYPKGLRNLR